MDILPDKTTFDHLTKSSSRVPVCGLQKCPGLDLSKLFQEIFQDTDNTFLFESGNGPEETAHYSFMGMGKKEWWFQNGMNLSPLYNY